MASKFFEISETLLMVGTLGGYTSHGIFVPVGDYESKSLTRLEHACVDGSGVFTVERYTRSSGRWKAVPELLNVATSTTQTVTNPTDLGIADGDRFRVVFDAAIAGTPPTEPDGCDIAFYFKVEAKDV